MSYYAAPSCPECGCSTEQPHHCVETSQLFQEINNIKLKLEDFNPINDLVHKVMHEFDRATEIHIIQFMSVKQITFKEFKDQYRVRVYFKDCVQHIEIRDRDGDLHAEYNYTLKGQ